MEETVRDRLLIYLKKSEIKVSHLEREVGLGSNYFGNIKSIGAEKLHSILQYLPDLSAEWLMRGEGQMLRGQDKVAEPVTVEILREQLREKDRQIERLLGLLEGRK